MIEATSAPAANALSNNNATLDFTDEVSAHSEQKFNHSIEKNVHCDPATDVNCMDNRLLEGMQHLKSGYDEKVTAINDAVNVGQLTVQDVMKLQLEIAKLQMQEELMAKTASKTTQNVDTLLKSQ